MQAINFSYLPLECVSVFNQTKKYNQAGVSHCSIDNDGDFEYVGLYPKTNVSWHDRIIYMDPRI